MYRSIVLMLCVSMLAFAACEAKKAPVSDTADDSQAASTSTPTVNPETVATNLVTALAAGDTAKAMTNFDATMTTALPASKLGEVWSSVNAQFGSFKSQVGTRTERIQGFNAVFVTCEFERGKLDIQVTVDDAGKVSGLFVRPAQG